MLASALAEGRLLTSSDYISFLFYIYVHIFVMIYFLEEIH